MVRWPYHHVRSLASWTQPYILSFLANLNLIKHIKNALTNLSLETDSPPGLVAARLLGYLLVHSENGRPELAREIINASDDAAVVVISLALHYITRFCHSHCTLRARG